ncbi:MAG: 50S ribosomal protein L5 [Alphaproteobacteria bacterium]
MTARLREQYESTIKPALARDFGHENAFAVPRLVKIVVNMGVGETIADQKKIENAAKDLSLITGQKPLVIASKKAIANFKLRRGIKIGCKVTLRGDRMYEFLDRLVNIALPRVRDFRGLSSGSFDGRGNFSLGLREQIVFPEIDYDSVDEIRGMDVVIVTSAESDSEALALLKGFNMPFVN